MTSSLTNFLQALRIVPGPKGVLASSTGFTGKQTIDILSSDLPEITLEEVSQHDDYSDCWIVIYDRVYDVTDFLSSHPGGEDVIMDHAGRDATLAFHGTGHSRDAIEQMRDFLIGELPLEQRIFRTSSGNVLSSGVPE